MIMTKEQVEAEVVRRSMENPSERIAKETPLASPESFMDELRAKFPKMAAVEPMTSEELQKSSQRALEALEERNRYSAWSIMAAGIYAEPFDMTKVADSVDRSEVQKVLDWQFSPKGIYVVGNSGGSKSRAVYAMLRRQYLTERRDVRIMDGPSFASYCSAAFANPEQTEERLNALVEPQILFIDDLFKRFTPATEDGAFTVIERRTSRKKPILITINYDANDLTAMSRGKGDVGIAKDMMAPILRRLAEFCEVITF